MVLSCFIIRPIIHKALITDPLNNDCGSLLGVTFRGCDDERSKDRSSRLPSLANGVGPISASSWMHGNGACNKSVAVGNKTHTDRPWYTCNLWLSSPALSRCCEKFNLITCRVLCKAQCEDVKKGPLGTCIFIPLVILVSGKSYLPDPPLGHDWTIMGCTLAFQGPIRVFGRPWFRHGLQMIVGQMTESNTPPND